jgi:hypothetical protein
MSSNLSLSGTPRTIGNVASTIGTAPRSPAQDRNALLPDWDPEEEQGTDDGQRPGGKQQDQSDSERGQDLLWQPVRGDEQPEQDEQTDLGEPAEPFGEGPGRGPMREPGIGQDQCCEVGGKEAAGVRGAAGGEGDDAQPEGGQRVEAGGGQRNPT